MRYVKAIWTMALFSIGMNASAQSVCDDVSVQHEVSVRLKLVVALHERGIDLSKVNFEELLKVESRKLEELIERNDLNDVIGPKPGTNGSHM